MKLELQQPEGVRAPDPLVVGYGIPLSNFIGWFAVSAVIFAVLRLAPGRWAGNPWGRRIGVGTSFSSR